MAKVTRRIQEKARNYCNLLSPQYIDVHTQILYSKWKINY
jgi:hypothetical protein